MNMLAEIRGRPVVALAALLPVAITLNKRLTDAVSLLLLLASLWVLAQARLGTRQPPRPAPPLLGYEKLWIAMLCAPCVLTFAQTFDGRAAWSHSFETPLRYLSGVAVLMAARRIEASAVAISRGCLVGLVTGLLMGAMLLDYVLQANLPEAAARGMSPNGYVGIIPFSALCAMFGFIGAGLIALRRYSGMAQGTARWTDRMWIVLVLLAGFSVGLVSSTRTTWVLILVVGVGVLNIAALFALRQRIGLLVLTGLLAAMLFVAVGPLRERVLLAGQQFENYYGAGTFVSTSIGERLVLWNFATHRIMEHPLLGVGARHFKAEVLQAEAQGRLPAKLTPHPHPHDEFLLFGFDYGVPGMVLLGLLYAVPLHVYRRAARGHPWRALCFLPLFVLPLGFLTGGLTDVLLFWDVTVTFYVLVISYLLGAARRSIDALAVGVERPA